jgi:ribonuclease-3
MVCTDALHAWALDLGVDLLTGPRSPKRAPAGLRNALADAMEALLAAVFLDVQAAGGDPLAGVFAIIERRFMGQIRAAYVGIWEAKDHKTTLQERGAALSLPQPRYELLERKGPDHAPTFTVRAVVGRFEAEGRAGTLKQAQMEAARLLLAALPPAGKPS